MKYSKKTVKAICDLIKKDTYTIAELCAIVGISDRCYYDWQLNNAQFAESIAQAREQAREIRIRDAKNSLMKKVNGYTVQEKHTTYIDVKDKDGRSTPRIKEQKIVDKHFQPDTAAIIFTLTNDDPENWKNRSNAELTGKDGKDLINRVTDDELDARIKELENKITK